MPHAASKCQSKASWKVKKVKTQCRDDFTVSKAQLTVLSEFDRRPAFLQDSAKRESSSNVRYYSAGERWQQFGAQAKSALCASV